MTQRSRFGRLGVVVGVAALAAGCAAVPNVRYHQLHEGRHADNWVLFRLTDSVIAVGVPAHADAGKDGLAPPASLARADVECDAAGCGDVAVAVAPTDFDAALYAIEPASRHLVSTNLSPTYQPNSLRLKALSVEAKDHRLEAINTIGAIATGVAKLAGSARSTFDPTASPEAPPQPAKIKLKLPITIDLADAACEAPEMATCGLAIVADPADHGRHGGPQPLPENPGWTYTLRFLDNPRASGLVHRADLDGVHAAMVASTCRPAILEIVHGGVRPLDLRVDLADPDWLQTAPFPAKGSVVFHTLCGVDVEAQATTEIGTDALASAFFNNVAAVRAAQKK